MVKHVYNFFKETRRLFGKKKGKKLLKSLEGDSLALVLDTSAIIDLEARDNYNGGDRGKFLNSGEKSRILIPSKVYEECIRHKNTRLNGYETEISSETFNNIKKAYHGESSSFFRDYWDIYGDQFKFDAYNIAKEVEESSDYDAKSGEIARADTEVLARALEARSLQEKLNWEGFIPSDIVIATSDHHIRDMWKVAMTKEHECFDGIDLFFTR